MQNQSRFPPISRSRQAKIKVKNSTSNTINTAEPIDLIRTIMNTDSTTDLFNTLRIPDAIKDLPRYDGNPRLLFEFINNVEEILICIKSTDNTPYGKILLRAIRNKIEGRANEVLNTYGTPLNWDAIKTNLITHYSDKRSETSLIRDLHCLKQLNKSIEEIYRDVIEIQSSLMNNILIHEQEKSVVKAKTELFSEMCLNIFLSGLREPIGSIVRAMKPESLAAALENCIKEQNIHYLKTEKPLIQTQGQFRNQSSIRRPHQWATYPYIKPFPFRTPIPNSPNIRNINYNNQYGNISYPKSEPMASGSGYSRFTKNSNNNSHSYSLQNKRNEAELNNINTFRTNNKGNYYNANNGQNSQGQSYEYENYESQESNNIDDSQDFCGSASDRQGS